MDKVKSAVRMFVHSCAGYSVATYVLVSAKNPDIISTVDSPTDILNDRPTGRLKS